MPSARSTYTLMWRVRLRSRKRMENRKMIPCRKNIIVRFHFYVKVSSFLINVLETQRTRSSLVPKGHGRNPHSDAAHYLHFRYKAVVNRARRTTVVYLGRIFYLEYREVPLAFRPRRCNPVMALSDQFSIAANSESWIRCKVMCINWHV
jgi:hypothetical protein